MADQYSYEESMRSDTMPSEVFSSKNFVYINDSNAGVYTGNQVIFDCAQFYNQSAFINPSEMILTIPIVCVLSQSAAAGLGNCDFALAVKSGFHQFIQSIQISYNNNDVVALSPNINYYVSYKLNTTFSKDDLETKGRTIGFYPDSYNSWKYSTAADVTGNGSRNNFTSPIAGLPYFRIQTVDAAGAVVANSFTVNTGVENQTYAAGTMYNTGMFERQLTTNTRIDTTDGSTLLRSQQSLQNELYNYQSQQRGPNANDYNAVFITAVVRLKDLADFFDKMPMVRGFYARLIINLNIGRLQLTYTNAGTTLSCATASNTFTNTCPILVAPYNDGLNLLTPAADKTIYVGCYVARVQGWSQQNFNLSHPLTNCRLYAPIINMLPEFALSYIQSNQTKLVEYTDVYSTSFLNVPVGAQFNYLVAPSISGAQKVIVIPFVSATVNNLGVDNTAANQQLTSCPCSPFASEPATTSPLLSITSFNVQLAGMNARQQNINYTFEEFIQEVACANSINGNLSDGISSGLISKLHFENNYRYYVLDLSRKSKDDIAPKSINLLGINNNLVLIDLYVFVEFQKSIKINVETGNVIQ